MSKVPSKWTPQGKRKRGRAKTTWQRTVTSELKEFEMTWGEIEHCRKGGPSESQIEVPMTEGAKG